jgi:hypothetical protein
LDHLQYEYTDDNKYYYRNDQGKRYCFSDKNILQKIRSKRSTSVSATLPRQRRPPIIQQITKNSENKAINPSTGRQINTLLRTPIPKITINANSEKPQSEDRFVIIDEGVELYFPNPDYEVEVMVFS